MTPPSSLSRLFEIFDLSECPDAALFEGLPSPWDVLPKLSAYIRAVVNRWPRHPAAAAAKKGILIEPGCTIEESAVIRGPAIIRAGTLVRSGALIRENVIVGKNCIIGNSSELKCCVIMNQTTAAHFNYLGDSVIGHNVLFGSGAATANTRLFPGQVRSVGDAGELAATGKKLGALVGHNTKIGCNTVLNPGSIIGKGCVIYPLVNWRGYLADGMVSKNPVLARATTRIRKRA